jgi:hypothetical protein
MIPKFIQISFKSVTYIIFLNLILIPGKDIRNLDTNTQSLLKWIQWRAFH